MSTTSRHLVAVALAAALAVGVGCQPAEDGRRAEPTPTPSDTARYRPGKPALAVKLDNVGAARPPKGLGAADIVYVEPVEAGLSRLLAVFGTRQPKTVGPVRSARESDLELLEQYGRPAFAYSGARSSVLPDIRRAPLVDVSPARAGNAYVRDGSRRAPHNLFARPAQLLDRADKAKPPPDIGFRYDDAPAGGKPTASRTAGYRAFDAKFDWSKAKRRWLVSMDGKPHRTANGARSAAATVVIQYVDIEGRGPKDKFGNVSPYVTTTGSGRAVVLRDGKAYQARWSRPTAGEGTKYTTKSGKRMPFARGQTWVMFAAR
ncbi:MAG: DUF3048 domain-containing protein [Streptosporangiales bacterium]|nr:DUF3048 domain-containing protein [Streptosporangiales bacterium]